MKIDADPLTKSYDEANHTLIFVQIVKPLDVILNGKKIVINQLLYKEL